MARKFIQNAARSNAVFEKVTAKNIVGGTNYRGVANVASGDTFVAVTAVGINSGFPVILTAQTNVASARSIIFSVNSIVDATSFMIVGDKATTDTVQVNWISML